MYISAHFYNVSFRFVINYAHFYVGTNSLTMYNKYSGTKVTSELFYIEINYFIAKIVLVYYLYVVIISVIFFVVKTIIIAES